MAVWRSAALDPVALDPAPVDTCAPGPHSDAPPGARRVTRWREALDVPFVRNAYSLVGSTLATAALGFAFWTVAARMFSPADVGRDAALISIMLFLSSISQLNLTNGFNRFVPTAGHRTRRLVLLGYAATTAAAAVASTVFVLGVNLWAPRLSLLQDHPGYGAWFVAGTVVWTLFALQDAVLAGLGEARFVLIENVAYGIVKLVLLVAVATALPLLGVFAAWTAPLAVAVVAINVLIFRRLVPTRNHPPLEPIDAGIIRHYVGFDMVGTIMMTATIGLLPVISLAIIGPKASAYLYVSWTIAYSLYLVSIGVGMSFVTESARAPDRIIDLARTMILHALRIVVPLAAVVAVAAPLILRIPGEAYSQHATRLLQGLVLSAIPNVIMVTYLSIARVQRRMSAVIATTGCLALGVLTLSVVLMPVIGVAAVGVAWLVTQTAIAVVLLLGELRTVWIPYLPFDRLRPFVTRRAARVAPRQHRDSVEQVAAALEEAGVAAGGWAPADAAASTEGIRLVEVRDADGRAALLTVATTTAAADAVRREVSTLTAVRAGAEPALLAVVPEPLRAGTLRATWSLETRGDGVDARRLLDLRARWSADAVERLESLYRRTARVGRIGPELTRLLDLPVAAIEALPGSTLRVRADNATVSRLQAELGDELTRGPVTLARVHGNLWPGSVRADPERGTVVGILGWERSRIDLPAVDVMHLVCSTRGLVEDHELGAVVRAVLADGLTDSEAALVERVPGGAELSTRAVVLLMWLRHVHQWLGRGDHPRPGAVWVSQNVHQVLESV